jgi:hypothetical protein
MELFMDIIIFLLADQKEDFLIENREDPLDRLI